MGPEHALHLHHGAPGTGHGQFHDLGVPSNLKLIDRATRYIQHLTGLDYPSANLLLFDVIDYVEPRMKSDQAYPPVVAMAVLRHRLGITNEQAEASLRDSAPETPGNGNPVVQQASMPA